MTMKVLYEKGSLRILGAQIVGYEGVDKRIDVLATAMQMGGKVTDLTELDLAYAPPYSSAKDPVNMAGFMAENIEAGLVKQFHWDQVADLPRDGSVTLLMPAPPWSTAGAAPGVCEHPGGRAAPAAGGDRSPEARLRHVPERTAELSGLPHPGPARV